MLSVALILVVSLSTKEARYDPSKSTAEVEMISGFYVFVDSKPVKEFDYKGTVKSGGSGVGLNPQYTNIRDNMIKKARKEYPDADGIILHLNAGGSDKGDVIKFK